MNNIKRRYNERYRKSGYIIGLVVLLTLIICTSTIYLNNTNEEQQLVQIKAIMKESESLAEQGATELLIENCVRALEMQGQSKEYRNDSNLSWQIISVLLDNLESIQQAVSLLEDYAENTHGLSDEALIRLYGNIGQLYSLTPDYSLALQYYWQGIERLDSSEKIPNRARYTTKFLSVIGDIAFTMEQFDTAVMYYDESIKSAQKSGMNDELTDINSLTLINKASAYIELGKDTDAAAVLEELDKIRGQADIYEQNDIEILQKNLQAQLAIKAEDFTTAKQRLKEADILMETCAVEYSKDKDIYLDYTHAQLKQAQGDLEQALVLWKKVAEKSNDVGAGLEKSAYYAIAKIYAQQGNITQCLEYREKYADILDNQKHQLGSDYISYSYKLYQFYASRRAEEVERVIMSIVIIVVIIFFVIASSLLLQWRKKSYHDELTHLHNRRYLTAIIKRYKKKLLNHSLSLILVDVDYFKLYNDHYGHLQGDKALRAVADVLRSATRKKDIVIRYGGEEMLLILPNISRAQSEQIAKRIQKKLSEKNISHKKSPVSDHLTVSMGLVTVNYQGEDIFDIIALADTALYCAKTQGRNCYCHQ